MVAKITKTPAKAVRQLIKAKKVNMPKIQIHPRARKTSNERFYALEVLERNALDMAPDDYIRARSYLSSIELERLVSEVL